MIDFAKVLSSQTNSRNEILGTFDELNHVFGPVF